jgi:competence ComEA-like helix-hairpin-helix protein
VYPTQEKSANKEIILAIESIKNNETILASPGTGLEHSEKKITYFNFNPNNMQDSSWVNLGLSDKQIRTINNYLSKGGSFRIKSDFKKMYCISNEKFEELKPYLLLPDSFSKSSLRIQPKPISKKSLININDADSVELISLKGIGPVLASRIVRFRDKLGGFVSVNQLKEVFGINDTLFQNVLEQISSIKLEPYRFIHLNTDSFNVLASHPYIRGKVAGLICNYRKQHSSFISLEELKLLPLITEENFLKLAPYLKLD